MSERTEAPSGKRLAEARQRGQVPHSIELNAAAALLVGFWLLRGPGARVALSLQALMQESITTSLTAEVTGAWLRGLIAREGLRLLPDLGLIILGLAATGVTVTLAQTGLLWAGKNLKFDLDRVNPLTGLKRLFSSQGLIQLGRALLKLLVVGWVAYSYLRGQIESVLTLGQTDVATSLARWGELAYGLALRVGGAYLVLALADYFYQRWNIMRSLKMTKEEVKEDMKSQEGDPFIRSRIRGQQRRMARQRMLSRVPKADVVITNPTHFAVALQYDRASMRAPQVVAKGAALVAQRIKAVALEHDVPIIENPPVARALYAAADIDDEVPAELYRAVAEVLAFVYSLKSRQRSAVSLLPPAMASPHSH